MAEYWGSRILHYSITRVIDNIASMTNPASRNEDFISAMKQVRYSIIKMTPRHQRSRKPRTMYQCHLVRRRELAEIGELIIR